MTTSTLVMWRDGALNFMANVSSDRATFFGDGVFETIALFDSIPIHLAQHLIRLRQSCQRVGLELAHSDDELYDAILEVSAHNRTTNSRWLRARITVTSAADTLSGFGRDSAASHVNITAHRYVPTKARFRLVSLPWQHNEHSAISGLKTTSALSSVLAQRYAHNRHADEGLWFNTAGNLSEAIASNVFVVDRDVLITPRVADGCLSGITRAALLAVAPADGFTVREESVSRARLDEYLRDGAGLILTNSLRGVVAVASCDDYAIADSDPVNHLVTKYGYRSDYCPAW